MKTKAIVAGAVVLVVLLFIAILLVVPRHSRQAITIRPIGSVQSSNVTTMTFEITSHVSSSYDVLVWWVEARNASVWRRCGPIKNLDSIDYDSKTKSYKMTLKQPLKSDTAHRMVVAYSYRGAFEQKIYSWACKVRFDRFFPSPRQGEVISERFMVKPEGSETNMEH